MPLIGTLDLADRLLDRAGECAALVAEQLGLQQVLRDRAAVDGDERLLGARSEVVQRLRQRLLAGAALAQQQHRHVGRRELLDVAAELQHRLVGGDDPLDRRACRHRGKAAVLVLQPMQVETALDDRAQHLELDRLLAEIVGAEADRLQRGPVLAIAGDDDHLGLGRDAQYFLQRGQAFGHAIRIGRQAEIQDHDRRVLLLHHRHARWSRARHHHLEGREGPAILRAQTFVILDDQQFRFDRHGDASGRHAPRHPRRQGGPTAAASASWCRPAGGSAREDRRPPRRSSSRAW